MKLSCFLLPGILIITTFAIWSCSKSNNGKPQISIQSINSPIQPGESLTANVKFSGGSKLAKGQFLAIRTRINQIPPQNNIAGDTILIDIPDFSADKGEIEFIQPYNGYLHFDDHVNDTLVFKFAVLDVDQKSSDTVTSAKVIVINP
jgi:hypothetical protein